MEVYNMTVIFVICVPDLVRNSLFGTCYWKKKSEDLLRSVIKPCLEGFCGIVAERDKTT